MKMIKNICVLVAALFGALASPAALADEMFLSFGTTIIGDSTDAQHPGEVVLLSYSVSVRADSSWTKGGGASVGKPDPGPLLFTSDMNRAIPPILLMIATGRSVPTATLTVRSTLPGNKPGFEYVKYTFTDLFFTSVDQGLAGIGRAVTAVSAVYKTLQMQQFAPGNPVPVSCMQWNIPAGTAGPC